MEEKIYHMSINCFLQEISSVQPLNRKDLERNIQFKIEEYLHSIGIYTFRTQTTVLFQDVTTETPK